MLQLVQDLRSGEVEVVDLPDPSPRAGRVLVATRFSVISPGTEQALSRIAGKNLVGKHSIALTRPERWSTRRSGTGRWPRWPRCARARPEILLWPRAAEEPERLYDRLRLSRS